RERLLVEEAAVSDDAEDRELPVVQHVSQGVARLEQPRALDEHERTRAAEVEPSGDRPCLALAAHTHQAHAVRARDRVAPLPDGAVGDGDDVRDSEVGEERRDLFTRKHGATPEMRLNVRSAIELAIRPRRIAVSRTRSYNTRIRDPRKPSGYERADDLAQPLSRRTDPRRHARRVRLRACGRVVERAGAHRRVQRPRADVWRAAHADRTLPGGAEGPGLRTGGRALRE